MDEDGSENLRQLVATTQRLLGTHIQKPVLAEKYLVKPPFRFLHQIFTSVIESTGFMKEDFSKDELKYENLADIDQKRSFLRKAIEAIEKQSGEKCEARPSKILSGKEPERTNELLHLLVKAITNNNASNKLAEDKESSHTAKDFKKPTNDKAKTKPATTKMTRGSVRPERSRPPPASTSHTKNQATNKVATGGESRRGEEARTKIAKDPITKRPLLDKKKPIVSDKPKDAACGLNKSDDKFKSSSQQAEPKASKESVKGAKSSSGIPVAGKQTAARLAVASKSRSKQSVPVTPVKSVPSKTSTPVTTASLKAAETLSEPSQVERQGPENTPIAENDDEKITNPEVHDHELPELPSPMEDIPLQRPVTRTKDRQKNISRTPSKESLGQEGNPLSSPREVLLDTSETPSKAVVAQDVDHPDSFSSDEGITEEQMNRKISEWRSVSQEKLDFQSGAWFSTQGQSESNANSSKPDRVTPVLQSSTENVPEHQSTGNALLPLSSASAYLKQEGQQRRPVTVLMDNEEYDEDDDAFLVEERMETEQDLTLNRLQSVLAISVSDMTHIPPEHRGLLVNQIMETQRELEQLASHEMFADMHNELAERDKEARREVYMKQIESLKAAIQKMAKCANPLANIVQRSQDDACLMEIEFRKLRQENDKLQRMIEEAKAETLRTLCPLTAELSQLDSRIDKMEGAILLAKQRLHIMDDEYNCDFMCSVEERATPTGDQDQEKSSVWEFAKGGSDDEGETNPIAAKSLLDVFQRAVLMNDSDATMFQQSRHRLIVPPPKPTRPRFTKSRVKGEEKGRPGYQPLDTQQRISRKVQQFGNRQHNCDQEGEQSLWFGEGTNRFQKEPELAKDIKPPWWD